MGVVWQWKPVEHSARDLPTVYVLCTKWHSFQPGFCCASDTVPTHVATGQCGHRTFGMDVGWFYNDGGRFADTFFIVGDSGRQCKTVENSGRQWKTFANSLVTVEEVALFPARLSLCQRHGAKRCGQGTF